MRITRLLQITFYFVVVNERRFQEDLTSLDSEMTGYGNIAKTKQDGS